MYEAEDRGWLLLHHDGRVEVTTAGRAWRLRAHLTAVADPFTGTPPGVAA
ncbi:hypothetical protein [Micromonospora sediminicola]